MRKRPCASRRTSLFEQNRNVFWDILISRTDANFPAGTATRPEPLNLFGPSPLMEGEDIGLYDDLLTRISTAMKPTDILEDIWVREVLDLVWKRSACVGSSGLCLRRPRWRAHQSVGAAYRVGSR
jgi:hypothetical protein